MNIDKTSYKIIDEMTCNIVEEVHQKVRDMNYKTISEMNIIRV